MKEYLGDGVYIENQEGYYKLSTERMVDSDPKTEYPELITHYIWLDTNMIERLYGIVFVRDLNKEHDEH